MSELFDATRTAMERRLGAKTIRLRDDESRSLLAGLEQDGLVRTVLFDATDRRDYPGVPLVRGAIPPAGVTVMTRPHGESNWWNFDNFAIAEPAPNDPERLAPAVVIVTFSPNLQETIAMHTQTQPSTATR